MEKNLFYSSLKYSAVIQKDASGPKANKNIHVVKQKKGKKYKTTNAINHCEKD